MVSTERTAPENVSPWLVGPLKTITDLARLQDNWDSYGSPSLQPAAVEGAIRLLLTIDPEKPPAPHIGPVPGGGIQIEWHTPARELELEILPDGSVQFLTVTNGDQMVEGDVPSAHSDDIRNLVRWLMNK